MLEYWNDGKLERTISSSVILSSNIHPQSGYFSNIPIFHDSIIPLFHHSIIPVFQYSSIPVFQYSVPVFQRSK
jgi:hypothetical protein